MDIIPAERMQEVSATISAIKGESYATLAGLFTCIVWNVNALHQMTHQDVPKGSMCALFERLEAQLDELGQCAGIEQEDVFTMIKAVMSDTEVKPGPGGAT